MKILIARMNHETNTFSPVPTPLQSFDPQFGESARRSQSGMRTAMAAFLDAANRRGATAVTPLAAMANPSGPVQADAYEAMCRPIVDAAPGCDAILLDLHGAMVAEHLPDGEGELLARVRAAAPGVPIGVALDLHGNVTARMVDNADVMVGFKTYPHVDMYETGEHVARLLLQMADGQARFAVQWRRVPLLCHTLRSTTLAGAMQQVVDSARQAEAAGIPAATVFAGFPLADIEAPCMSVVVTGHADAVGVERARTVADRIAQQIQARREGFVYQAEPLARSLERARAVAEGADKPVLLLDHGDNCMSGGTCDTMDVLQAALEAGLRDIAVGPIADPEAVAALFAAGVGQPCDLQLGNKVSLASLGLAKTPLRVRGTVRALSDGSYTVTGPIYTGQRCSMGRTALLDTGAARIVVTELPHEPWDLGVFTCVGVDVTAHRFVLLKSRMYCRPVFGPLSAALVECDSAGVTSSDYRLFPFQRVRRPVYPLDDA